jgi:pimeloyl-ACP methyl ester carboxylesterase
MSHNMLAVLLFLASFVCGSTPAGDLPVSKDFYSLPGFDCGDGTYQNGTVAIYYPTTLNGTYPIVSFLHGSGGGHFDDLCYSTASLGIAVVAVAKGTCGDLTQQQLHAASGSQYRQDLHPALAHVKYNSMGVMGHSQGGAFTMGSATHAYDYNIKAMVASHGGSQDAAPQIPKDIPCLFVTGSGDPRRRKLYWAYQATPARPAIFANMEGGSHMEPAHGGRMNEFMAHFQGCYLIPRQESCDLIYGDSPDSMSHKNPMVDCDIQKRITLRFARK